MLCPGFAYCPCQEHLGFAPYQTSSTDLRAFEVTLNKSKFYDAPRNSAEFEFRVTQVIRKPLILFLVT